jgi:hypothetical protein
MDKYFCEREDRDASCQNVPKKDPNMFPDQNIPGSIGLTKIRKN